MLSSSYATFIVCEAELSEEFAGVCQMLAIQVRKKRFGHWKQKRIGGLPSYDFLQLLSKHG